MNATMIAALVASLGFAGALAYMIWRFDQRDQRRPVLEAERIVAAEARRLGMSNHPSGRAL